MGDNKEKIFWGLLRLAMGWTFFWGFIDKVFGLGFATCVNKKTMEYMGVLCDKGTWLTGSSPTFGFLKFSAKGPFASIFQGMAGNPIVDWLFMMGLLLIGLALLLGIGVRIAGYSGALMLILMYAAAFIPPLNNPFLDDHIVNAIIMLAFAVARPESAFGLAGWWKNLELVKKYPILE